MPKEPLLGRAIIEMLGAPREYIENTLKTYVQKLKKEGLHIVHEEYAPAEEKGKFFSVFVDLEIRFKDYLELLNFCFDSMPSSVEIIEPAEIKMNPGDLTDFLNDLQARLHEVDLVFKTSKAEKELLDRNAMNVLRNFIRMLLQNGPKPIEDLSKSVGIKPEELKPILNHMLEQHLLKKEEEQYVL